MKRKLVMALIPVLAAGGLIGTAFSAWVFNSEASATVSNGLNGTVAVTPVVNASDLKVTFKETTTTFKLQLDQGGQSNLDVEEEGISFTENGLNNDTFDFSITLPDTFDAQTQDVTVKFYIGITKSYSENMTSSDSDTYIVFANGDQGASSIMTSADDALKLDSANITETDFGTNGHTTYKYSENSEGDVTTRKYDFDVTVLDNQGRMFYYAEGEKPKNKSQYDDMVEYYNNATLTVFMTVEVNVIDK